MAKKSSRRKKRKLTPESLEGRRHKGAIRTSFMNCGFEHIPTRNVTIQVAGRDGDLDALFSHENIMVIVEDTALSNQKKIKEHFQQKAEYFRHLSNNEQELLATLRSKSPKFRGYLQRHSRYSPAEFRFVYVYSPLRDIDSKYVDRHKDICKCLDYARLQYFLSLSRTIHRSARFELLKFLGFDLQDIGIQMSGSQRYKYEGLLLPEVPSGFPRGHKIVSFLVDPKMLLEASYVLRSDSWRDEDCLYQRLLIRNKIRNMREFLTGKRRVYINNIIATLPDDTVLRDKEGQQVNVISPSKIQPVSIEFPKRFNAIGIIDGQHRIFSYHEGIDKLDSRIAPLREKQHLLVTGIVYPTSTTKPKKYRFEAELFLEINDKQKRVKGDLKQAIERIVNPCSAIAIARAVISELATSGPLCGKLEVHFFDRGKIKTTSIVSYGMRHIVSLDTDHSFYRKWRGSDKQRIKSNPVVLKNYITYCSNQINQFLAGFKQKVPESLWTTDRKVSRALTTTTINGLIYCLRLLIINDKLGNYRYYESAFKRLQISFVPDDFSYKSSHWKQLGEAIYNQCFA